MIFTSITFLYYFLPVFLSIYFLTPYNKKNYILLVGSIIFYLWGAPKFLFILLLSCLIDFFISKKLKNIKSKKYLSVGVFLNIVLLGYFKYANFFVDNINNLSNVFGFEPFFWEKVALPLAISFFTFRKIAYLVDIYKDEAKPFNGFSNYLLFILFFPQLISGPITRYKDMYNDIIDRKNNINIDNVYLGSIRFILGLSKKVFIANVLEKQANIIFNSDYSLLSTEIAWLGMLIYTFQIYYDFSSYSDMAIGLAKILGFNLPENFDFPYISKSISEFWRRWHMTLGNWLKTYVYIPLGGSRNGYRKTLINLFLVFLVSGIWHGSEWTFVIWGVIQGIFVVLDKVFLLKVYDKIGTFFSILITFFITNISWVFFRSETLTKAVEYFKVMLSKQELACNYDLLMSLNFDNKFWFILIIAVIFAFIKIFSFSNKLEDFVYNNQKTTKLLILQFLFFLILLIMSIGEFISADFQPFIYSNF